MKTRLINFFQKELIKGSIVIFAGGLFTSLLNYSFHLITGRLLGPANYAVVTSLISLVYITGFPGQLFNIVITKKTAQLLAKENFGEIKYLMLFFNKFILIGFFFAFILFLFFKEDISNFLKLSNSYYLIVVAVFVLLGLIGNVFSSILQGLKKFTQLILASIIPTVLKIVTVFIFLYLGFGVDGVLLSIIIASIAVIAVSITLLKNIIKIKAVKQKISFRSVKTLFWIGCSLLGMSLMINNDVIMIKHYFPDYTAGIYSSASNIGKIVLFLSAPILTVLLPIITFKKEKGLKHKKEILFSLAIVFGISLSIVVFYILFPSFVVNALYGSLYKDASAYIVILGIYYMFYSMCLVYNQQWFASGANKMLILPLLVSFLQLIGIIVYHFNIFYVMYIMVGSILLLFTLNTLYFLKNER